MTIVFHNKSYGKPKNHIKIRDRKMIILFIMMGLLLFSIDFAYGSICTANGLEAYAITNQEDSVTGSATLTMKNVVPGPISNSLYYLTYLYISASFKTVIRKMDENDNMSWTAAFPLSPIGNSLTVDSIEQYLYFATETTNINVARLQASNGAVVSGKSHNGVSGAAVDVKIYILSDNSGYYLITFKTSNSYTNICKYQYTTPSSTQCQEISNSKSFGYGQLRLNEEQFFFLSTDFGNSDLLFIKVTFDNSITNWNSRTVCASGPCLLHSSQSLANSDKSKIYSLFTYGPSGSLYLYFVTFDATSGNILGSRYISSGTCTDMLGSAINGNYIAATPYCLSYSHLLLIDTVSFSFTIRKYTGTKLFGVGIENISKRYVVCGQNGSNTFRTKFILESIEANPDFTTGIFSLNILPPGTSDINSESLITISAATTESVTNQAFINESVAYIAGVNTISNVYYQILDGEFSVLEDSSTQITPKLPCSSDGTTTISFSIENYNQVPVPSWISIDSSSGLLSVLTPQVSSDTNLYFYINSAIAGVSNPVEKVIKLKIIDCSVINCSKCSSVNTSNCDQCNAGYNLNLGSCVLKNNSSSSSNSSFYSNESKSSAEAISTTTQTIVITTVFICILSSIFNALALPSLWSMINQIQMFFLLILTRAYIPKEVEIAISGPNFVLNPYGFISIEDIYLIGPILDKFNFDLSNQLLQTFKISSDSTVYNTFPFFATIFLMIPLHILICAFSKLFTRCGLTRSSSCVFRSIKWFTNKVFIILTFGFYIRYALGMNQFILVSCISEIKMFSLSSPFRIIYLIIAFGIFGLCLLLIGSSIYLMAYFHRFGDNANSKFKEFFIELKKLNKFKLYTALILIRRTLLILLLLTLTSIPSKAIIGTCIAILVAFTAYVIIYRPFEKARDNIIAIINELYFLSLFSTLIVLNTDEDWSYALTMIYIWVLVSNTIIVFFIILIDIMRVVVIALYRRCSDSMIDDGQVKKIIPKETNVKAYKHTKENNKVNQDSVPNSDFSDLKEESKVDNENNGSNVHMIRSKY